MGGLTFIAAMHLSQIGQSTNSRIRNFAKFRDVEEATSGLRSIVPRARRCSGAFHFGPSPHTIARTEAPDPLIEIVHWEAVLRPHRSLSPRGFLALMLALGGVSFVSGVVFVSIGAWPVCGFFGLDVLLVYVAFRLNYRGARMREVVRLVGGDLTVERVGVRGERRHWRMQAFWLRVELLEANNGSNRLLVTTHGRSLPIGAFLTPDERRELARELTCGAAAVGKAPRRFLGPAPMRSRLLGPSMRTRISRISADETNED